MQTAYGNFCGSWPPADIGADDKTGPGSAARASLAALTVFMFAAWRPTVAWAGSVATDTLAYSSYNSSMVPYSMQALNRLMGMSH